jgi:protein-S-isoprenylcysteine O-methyltransferase Ste14
LAISLVAWSIKARKEESWLRHEFGAQFDEYTRSTGFLLPRLTRYPIS